MSWIALPPTSTNRQGNQSRYQVAPLLPPTATFLGPARTYRVSKRGIGTAFDQSANCTDAVGRIVRLDRRATRALRRRSWPRGPVRVLGQAEGRNEPARD